ncbi:MAG: OprO/OprP family phosphate-selective porin [Culturomica sp.]|nr:OprO/OprP family phosphate-selective porin [Culturomica sp.]
MGCIQLSAQPKISGLVNLRYQYNGSTDVHGFDIRRARVDVRGDLDPSVGYRVHVELANTPKLLDAYFQWKINDRIRLQAGQFKVPFSLENPYSPTTLETIDNSLAITSLVGYNDVSGISANGRDIGMSASGAIFNGVVEYALGMFNGAGTNKAEDNSSKDVAGTLTLHPVKNLSVAGYHYNGHGRIRSGGGVKYDDGKWLVRGEYIAGKTQTLHSDGAYAVVGVFVHTKVQTVVKADWFDRDRVDKATRQIYYTAGVNYLPAKNVKAQLNYSYRTSQAQKNYHYVALQLLGMF